jgi:alpha-L-rhamnosidase
VDAFRAEFVTPRGRLSSDTQTAYVLALAFDLLPEDLRDTAAERLAADVRRHGHLTTGFLGTPDLMHVLSRFGHRDVAYRLLLREQYPSWLYPVTMDATTIWERWDGQKPDGTFQSAGMNSFNHYAYGAVGDWLYGEVAGIQALEPGYRRILIAPRPGGGLSYARARHESAYGPIESSWELEAGSFRLEVTVPPNTRATVRLPEATLAAVTESGGPVAGAVQEGADVVVELGSGTYLFAYESETLPEPAEPFATDGTKVAELIADPATRAILRQHLPALMGSSWLSQVMGYPLERAVRLVPVDAPPDALGAVYRALAGPGR